MKFFSIKNYTDNILLKITSIKPFIKKRKLIKVKCDKEHYELFISYFKIK